MGLKIDASTSPPKLSYPSTAMCWYDEKVHHKLGSTIPDHEYKVRVSIRTVKGRLLLVMTSDNGSISSASIDPLGKLYDFNIATDGPEFERSNPGTAGQVATQILQRDQSIGVRKHILNEISLEIPEYERAPQRPGDTVGHVRSEDGMDWANFVYRGVTSYNGMQAALFDIEYIGPHDHPEYGPPLVGFIIVDAQTAMPILLAFKSGTEKHFEQISCS
jgi:hypothetical protein